MTELGLVIPDQLLDEIAQRAAALVNADARAGQPDPWLNVVDAASYLACRPQRIYNLVSQRRLRHVKDGSRVLFRRQWLDDHLEATQ